MRVSKTVAGCRTWKGMRLFLRLALPASLGTGALFLAMAACSDDGDTSFGPNVDLPIYDSGTDVADAGVDEITDGSTDGPKPGCTTGTVAILSGQGGLLNASVDRGRGFAVANITGTAADSVPAVVPFGEGFVAATRAGEELHSLVYASGWSPPARVNSIGTKGAPTLATDNATVRIVYPTAQGTDRHFFTQYFNGNGWGGPESVGTSATAYSFGTDSAGFAFIASDYAWVENGSGFMGDRGIYSRSLATSGAWTANAVISGAGTNGPDNTATPQVSGIGGNTYDAIALFVGGANEQTNHLGWLRRKKSDKTWSLGNTTHALLEPTLTVTERVNVARTGAGDVIVTFRAGDGNGYYVRGTLSETDGVSWSATASLGGETMLKVDSAPAIARGVCGSDAIVAFATDEGNKVQVTRLKDGAWTAGEQITGARGRLVAIATRGQ